MGKYYVLEGMDGSGKSTLIRGLKEAHPDWVFVAEPGGTDIGRQLRKIVIAPDQPEDIPPISEVLIYFAARIQLLHNVVAPALAEGKTVVSDRNWVSSLMYQGHGFGAASVARVKHLVDMTLSGYPAPDKYVYLRLDADARAARLAQRAEGLDRLEQRGSDYYVKLHMAYDNWARAYANVVTVDASHSIETVLADVLHHL